MGAWTDVMNMEPVCTVCACEQAFPLNDEWMQAGLASRTVSKANGLRFKVQTSWLKSPSWVSEDQKHIGQNTIHVRKMKSTGWIWLDEII